MNGKGAGREDLALLELKYDAIRDGQYWWPETLKVAPRILVALSAELDPELELVLSGGYLSLNRILDVHIFYNSFEGALGRRSVSCASRR